MAIYINGSLDVEAGIDTMGGGHAAPSDVVTSMGDVVVGERLYGNIAEVGVYRNSLSAAEVEGLSTYGLWPITNIDTVTYVHEVGMPSSAMQADLVASCVTAGFALVPETLSEIFGRSGSLGRLG